MKILINPGDSGNIIATIAISGNYYHSWEKHASPMWEKYCKRHNLGLVVFDEDLIERKSTFWKKRQWQKLLIGRELKKSNLIVSNVCYLDTDILINFAAPNVFDYHKPKTISLVSQKHNLPYCLNPVLRRIAFYRHFFYDKKYPLDSALFMSLEQIYDYHGLAVQKDYACTGFYIFDLELHSQLLEEWFYKYDRNVESITGGGEEAHVNYELQNWGKITWLDYRFQALWMYEMAWKYPFLYDYGRYNDELIRNCIEASLHTNYFLHFAGSWYDSDMWKIEGILENTKTQKNFEEFNKYLETPVTGQPKGQIRP